MVVDFFFLADLEISRDWLVFAVATAFLEAEASNFSAYEAAIQSDDEDHKPPPMAFHFRSPHIWTEVAAGLHSLYYKL